MICSTPPSILNGLVREEPRMVPPRGRMPRHCCDAELHGQPLERAPPAVAEADELEAVVADALADDRPDDRVETGAVAATGQHSDAHECSWEIGSFKSTSTVVTIASDCQCRAASWTASGRPRRAPVGDRRGGERQHPAEHGRDRDPGQGQAEQSASRAASRRGPAARRRRPARSCRRSSTPAGSARGSGRAGAPAPPRPPSAPRSPARRAARRRV